MSNKVFKMLLVACVSVFICMPILAADESGGQDNVLDELMTTIRAKLEYFGWRVRTYESGDKDIWGNQGVGAGGYIVGTPPGTGRTETAMAPQMLTESELQMLKDEISQSMQMVQFQKEQREELEYYSSQIESQLASYKEKFEILGGTTYIVQENDSLWRIARKEYGDANKWPLIYRANQSTIKNPNLIYAGQELQIPQLKVKK